LVNCSGGYRLNVGLKPDLCIERDAFWELV